MIFLYNLILYKPIFNFFVGLYNILPGHDIGIVILIMTIVIRLVLYPLTNSSIKSQKSLQELQPKMNEIKKLYAKDQQKQAQALMELYKQNKVNPFSSCLPLLIQLPILIALYSVMRNGLTLTDLGGDLYSFVSNPGQLNPVSLGFLNMAKPNIILALFAGAAQFWQTKMLTRKQAPKEAGPGAKDEDMMAMMNKQMLYMMPVMTVVIGASLPAGLTLYWLFSTVFTALQQMFLFKKPSDNPPAPSVPTSPNVIEGTVIEEKK
ncbi:MAG: YidC/Oxa1 family membrane protein insertase [bacterium]|nr:YidC/Oxa1 family membrane protein insertase [Patescibacteria group bacterium]